MSRLLSDEYRRKQRQPRQPRRGRAEQAGLARPAGIDVCQLATRFECEIFVEKEGEEVNGKSIMGLMMLAAGPGTTLTLHAEGGDADQAISELEQLVNRNFEEE